MGNDIVLDIETKDTFEEVGGYDPKLLHVSLVGVYAYSDDTYRTFLEHELSKLWPLLEHADAVIGYNINHFDFPVLNRYYPGDLGKFPTVDLLADIERAIGFRVKLENVGQATLGRGKTGTGLMAIQYFRDGDLKKLADYCLEDVKLTKELYDFVRAHGKLMFRDRDGSVKDALIGLQVPARAVGGLNLTIPF